MKQRKLVDDAALTRELAVVVSKHLRQNPKAAESFSFEGSLAAVCALHLERQVNAALDAEFAALNERVDEVRNGLLLAANKIAGKEWVRKELQARLDSAPFSYQGTYEAGREYDKGQFVTHNGSLWHCNAKTTTRPAGGPEWTLAVKSGRDAR